MPGGSKGRFFHRFFHCTNLAFDQTVSLKGEEENKSSLCSEKMRNWAFVRHRLCTGESSGSSHLFPWEREGEEEGERGREGEKREEEEEGVACCSDLLSRLGKEAQGVCL